MNKHETSINIFLDLTISQEIKIPRRKSRFTIVIPFYNDEDFIHLPIESLKSQTFEDFTAFLIDDGSTDASLLKASLCCGDDDRFKIVRKSNEGLSLTRNLGLELANSDLILFLDSDDSLASNSLERFNDCFKAHKLDLLFFEAKPINRYLDNNNFANNKCNEYSKHYTRKGKYQGVLTGPEIALESNKNHEFIPSACLSVCSLSFLRENKIKFIAGILHEDNPYTFELLLRAQRVLVLKEKLYLRSIRPGSIMTRRPSMINSWGYFQGFLRTHFLLYSVPYIDTLSEEQLIAFQKISFSLLNSARSQWREAKDKEAFLQTIPKSKRIYFLELVAVVKKEESIILSRKELWAIKLKRNMLRRMKKIFS